MRFIDTETLEFVELNDPYDRKYAILSHRWTADEVSHQNYLAGAARDSPGYAKIIDFCQRAKNDGFRRGWIDTCCIDRKSSAELSEAINSMYNWYYWAKVCYVYLVDVPSAAEAHEVARMQAFRDSQWWKRGWTLQELLAPGRVEFYDKAWGRIGTKQDLAEQITCVTRIEPQYLRRGRMLRDASIATKMSWASERSTTKPEDVAYCLLGLFNVNMALLYGEGAERAFVRLQLEIIKKSSDESIFAWHHQDGYSSQEGLLAPDPKRFMNASNIMSFNNSTALDEAQVFERRPFSMTNRGLKIRFPITSYGDKWVLVLLHCRFTEHAIKGRVPDISITKRGDGNRWLAVKLRERSNNQWIRDSPLDLVEVDPEGFRVESKAMYVIQDNL